MAGKWILAIFTGMALMVSVAQAGPWSFRWQQGQELTYKVEHVTQVAEVVGGKKLEMISKLNLLKRWEVQDVDAKGIATLRLSLAAMRNEQTRPNGEVLLFDSANLDKSTPELRERMKKHIGQTLAVVRVDGHGKVIEVIQGSAAQFESDPPFVLRLPGQEVSTGQAWERLYQITLEPPYGTGEKHKGAQQFQVTKVAQGQATIHLTTQFKMPESASERLPLLQKLPEGEIVFDIAAGRLQSVSLRIDNEVQGHQGEGSRYRFVSSYREQFVDGK